MTRPIPPCRPPLALPLPGPLPLLCAALALACDDTPSPPTPSAGAAPVEVAGAPAAGSAAGGAAGGGAGGAAGESAGGAAGESAGGAAGESAGGAAGGGGGGAAGGGAAALGAECAEACGALLACADACPPPAGADPAGRGAAREGLGASCEERCAAFAPFLSVAGGLDACDDWLSFAQQQLADALAPLCAPAAPPAPPAPAPELPECDTFAERLAVCLTDACPPFAPLAADARGLLSAICDQQAASGEVPRDAFAAVGPLTPCDAPILGPYVRYFTESLPGDPASGPLRPICDAGPLNPPERCAAACARLSPCIPPGGEGEALRDEAICRYFCGTSADVTPAVWECLEAAPLCASVGACFQ